MRKLLLASAAVIGVASAAQAQVVVVPTPTPGVPGVNPPAALAPQPAPGQIVVRMNGRFNWYAGFIADGDANSGYYYDAFAGKAASSSFTSTSPGIGTTTTITPAAGQTLYQDPVTNILYTTSGVGHSTVFTTGTTGTPVKVVIPGNAPWVRAKQNQGVAFESYIRLYPGFDGVAANGLKYGVAAEIRQDGSSGSGGGFYGSVSGSNRQRGALYWRRAYGYVGTDQLGTLRFGSGDGPSALFMTGNFENINDGMWNGDLPSLMAPNTVVTWPFADVGTMYTLNKVVYLSPSFAGFDFGLSWAPTTSAMSGNTGCEGFNTGGAYVGGGSPGGAGIGCDRLSSINVTSETTRGRNFLEAFARYRGAFGPVGLSAYGGYIGSGKITDTVDVAHTLRDGLSLGVGGAQITVAGVSVGGMVQGGRFNGQWALTPTGAPDSLAWLVGTSYTTGPIIVGASYYEYTSPGSYVPFQAAWNGSGGTTGVGSERKERGVAAGGTYAVAPGLSLFLSYLWGDRHQSGVNLLTGETNIATYGGSLHNTTTVQAVSLGTQLRW